MCCKLKAMQRQMTDLAVQNPPGQAKAQAGAADGGAAAATYPSCTQDGASGDQEEDGPAKEVKCQPSPWVALALEEVPSSDEESALETLDTGKSSKPSGNNNDLA
uniref:Uncharacterized protein n=1 Tax=Sphaerodactylus townsendi TaxID=933632 RepID=A0ACB8EVF8_9SAUR